MKNIGKKGRFSARAPHTAENVELKPKARKRNELDDSQYLELEELDRLFKHITRKRDRAIFRITYHRGLRAAEVALIQLADWKDRDGLLYVRRLKGSISRDHRLTEEEARALRAYIKDERGTKPGPMFPSRQGRKGISRYMLDKLMKKYCESAAIRLDKAHMHALKHSCGTQLRERGNSADEIQDWLGHRDSGSTDIYMHFSRRRREAAEDRNRDWK
jgi:integrase/recombinase XerD